MKGVTNQQSQHLAEASLEILHKSSHQWLNEIAFMEEEVRFLSSLLTTKSSYHNSNMESIEFNRELTLFSRDFITVLNKKIMEHEMWLTDIIRTDTLDRQKFYREIHSELAAQMRDCHDRFMNMKKKIFSYIKDNMESTDRKNLTQ